MHNEHAVELRARSLLLDFFPCRVEPMLARFSDTNLIFLDAKPTRATLSPDIRSNTRFYVQCDCG